MFSATVQSVNGSSNVTDLTCLETLNKRSKVCDADSNGNVNVNCRR